MNTPEVSVIIPTYNRANLLIRAINSVLKQSLQDFELIVVDDGSTDNTKEIVENFQKKESRIIYLKNTQNSGGAAAPKNLGIKNACGKYIATLDSDDVWLTTKLKKQVAVFEASDDSKMVLVTCDYFLVGEKSKNRIFIPKYTDILLQILTRDYLGTGSCVMYKREVFNSIGNFDENLKSCQDWDMRIRIFKKYNVVIIKEPLVEYYVHDSNISIHLSLEKREDDIRCLLSKHKSLYTKYPKADALQKRYIGTWYVMNGNIKKAINNFWLSIHKNPFAPMTYVLLVVSLFGSNVYKFVNRVKNYF